MNAETRPDFSVAILAGGQSRRMGRNKALLEIGGKALLQRVIDAVQQLTSDLFLVTNSPEIYRKFGLRMVSDAIPDKAALGGIYTAILAARQEWVLLLACDMPLLNPAVIAFLASYLREGDVVAPLVESQPETLHTFYKKSCLPGLKSRLEADQLRVMGFFEDVSVRYVDRAALALVTTDYHFLANLNTPQDLAALHQLIATDRVDPPRARLNDGWREIF